MIQIKKLLQILALVSILTSCNKVFDKKMEVSNQMVQELERFKLKPKFEYESDSIRLSYTGLQHEQLKPIVSELINKAANDFIEVARSKEASERKFQDKIQTGLSRFAPVYLQLDTEDREKVCYYFEELMDIVGLESSGGHLNDWMYGFDPTS